MTTFERRATSGVTAAVNYVRNPPPPGGEVLQFVTEAEDQSTMETLPGVPMWIANARGLSTDVDREGFALVDHVSAVGDFDAIGEDPEVDQRYTQEMEELLTRLTGATRVLMLGGGKKRYGEQATEKLAPLFNAKPARYPHADNTDTSAAGQVEMIGQYIDLGLERYTRWAMYNMWRAVSAPPQDVPLAVCDARSVAPEDEVTVTALTKERIGDIRHDTTGYLFNSAHRWHYYPDMDRDEVLLFKAHDTDPARSHRVPHSAFNDPTCPADVPTRASVETRGIAFFA